MPSGVKRVLITGASSGIGAALARELARRAYHLAITARRQDRLAQLANELRSLGAQVAAFPADLADPETPERLVSDMKASLGGIDVLINNAAYGLPRLYGDSDADAIRTQIEVNLTAPLLLTRLALPSLIESRGIVINVSSAVTSVANPVFGTYGATKSALSYWNDGLRRELRHTGVRVCLVEPGPVDTEFFTAVRGLADDQSALGIDPAPDGIYNAMRDKPPTAMAVTADDAARRIARLIDRPVRRLSFPRRTTWPWRALGAIIQAVPGFGDWAVSGMIQRIEREEAARRKSHGEHEPAGRAAGETAGRQSHGH